MKSHLHFEGKLSRSDFGMEPLLGGKGVKKRRSGKGGAESITLGFEDFAIVTFVRLLKYLVVTVKSDVHLFGKGFSKFPCFPQFR